MDLWWFVSETFCITTLIKVVRKECLIGKLFTSWTVNLLHLSTSSSAHTASVISSIIYFFSLYLHLCSLDHLLICHALYIALPSRKTFIHVSFQWFLQFLFMFYLICSPNPNYEVYILTALMFYLSWPRDLEKLRCYIHHNGETLHLVSFTWGFSAPPVLLSWRTTLNLSLPLPFVLIITQIPKYIYNH